MLRLSYLRPLLLAGLVIIARQFTGYFPMSFYAVSIFQATSASLDKYMATICIGLVTTVFTIMSSLTVDKVGAKRQGGIAAAVATVANALVTIYFALPSRQGVDWLALVGILMFMAAFSWGVSNLQNIIIGELIPIQIRDYGTGVLFATALLSVSTLLMLYEYLIELIGESGIFALYSISCAALTLFCIFVLPDTKGKTLREIEDQVTAINIQETGNKKK
jgi:hypothetical protein